MANVSPTYMPGEWSDGTGKNKRPNMGHKLAILDIGDPTTSPFICCYKVPLRENSVEMKHSLRDFMIELMLNGHLLHSIIIP